MAEEQGSAGPLATLDELRALIELSSEMLVIASFEGYFLEVSPAWSATLGYTPAELCAVPFVEFVHPDDRTVTTTVTDRLQQNGRLISFENRYRHKDGTYRALQWRSRVSMEKRRYYAVARDVTSRRDAHANEQILAAVTELSGEAIIIQAEDGTITSWNPGAERLSGYSAAEAVGKPMALVVDPDRSSMPPHFRDQLERTQGFEQMRTVLLHKDGTEVQVSMSVAPLGDGAGHITGAITVARPVPR